MASVPSESYMTLHPCKGFVVVVVVVDYMLLTMAQWKVPLLQP